jgi:murein DD-endopeptidase MepM/ murein hydrolase activator NlpD
MATATCGGYACQPPPPGRKEIVIAEPKAPAKSNGSFWNWLGLGRSSKTSTRRATPAPAPKPQPAAASTGFAWPVKGQIVTPYKGGWHNACHGIEIAAAEGTPVHAARDGMVLMAQAYPGYGNLVLIDHGDGFATAYGYNRQMLVHEGERVERGQTIASVGRPTQGSSSKLLFQVRRNALPVDPMQFLKDS